MAELTEPLATALTLLPTKFNLAIPSSDAFFVYEDERTSLEFNVMGTPDAG